MAKGHSFVSADDHLCRSPAQDMFMAAHGRPKAPSRYGDGAEIVVCLVCMSHCLEIHNEEIYRH